MIPTLAWAAQAPAGPPAPAPSGMVDLKARALLDTMLKAHRELKSFSANVAVSARSGGRTDTATGQIAFLRPSKARAVVTHPDGSRVVSVSDGAFRIRRGTDGKVKIDSKIKAETGEKAILQTFADANLFVTPIFYWSVADPNARGKLLPGQIARIGFGLSDDIVDSVACEIVVVETGGESGRARLEFAIGKEDHVLRRLSVLSVRGAQTLEFSEVYSSVKINPELPATLFAP